MRFLQGLTDVLMRLGNVLAIALFAALFALVLCEVALRYLFNNPLVWSEELAQYIFVWICFLGWLMASQRGEHIAVGAIRDRFTGHARTTLLVAHELATMLFAAVLVVEGLSIAGRNLTVATATLPFPFALVYAIVPVAGLMAALIALVRIGALIARPEAGPR